METTTATDRKTYLETTPLYDLKLYTSMRKVADIIHEYSSKGKDDGLKPRLCDSRETASANPFYGRTLNGLYLELYYGLPAELCTPWGRWSFCGGGSGHWHHVLPEILERFGATLHRPVEQVSGGTIGPFYALHHVDGEALPGPAELPGQPATFKELRAAWEVMTAQYRAEA